MMNNLFDLRPNEEKELMAFLNIPSTHIDRDSHPCVVNFFIKVVDIRFHDFTCRKILIENLYGNSTLKPLH